MFRGSEYRLTVIGAFPASAIVCQQLARDASAERCLLEVAGWSGTPSVSSTFGASLRARIYSPQTPRPWVLARVHLGLAQLD
jgi:hypothetical protein